MSSSDPTSYIALSDSPDEAAKKIRKYAFSGGKPTIEEHRRKGGNPNVDVAYQWLTFFEEDDKKLKKIYGGELKIAPKLFSRDNLRSKNIYRINVLLRFS